MATDQFITFLWSWVVLWYWEHFFGVKGRSCMFSSDNYLVKIQSNYKHLWGYSSCICSLLSRGARSLHLSYFSVLINQGSWFEFWIYLLSCMLNCKFPKTETIFHSCLWPPESNAVVDTHKQLSNMNDWNNSPQNVLD